MKFAHNPKNWLFPLLCAVHCGQSLANAERTSYAVNFGGSEYSAKDGTVYQADNLQLTADKGKTSDPILGTQDEALFKTFREGDFSLSVPLENGNYKVTLRFAEPENIDVGKRQFTINIQGNNVAESMDVRAFRDGKTLSDLTRTYENIQVTNKTLTLSLQGINNKPVIQAMQIEQISPVFKPPQDKWELVWQDEFDYTGQPNPKLWTADIWPARKVNDEDQAYTDRNKNLRVENGRLIIEAHKEQFGNAPYTSGRLHSAHKGDLHYGRIEIRAKLPAGQGVWSALWMLPTDPFKYATLCKAPFDWQGSPDCDAWPNSGEIDIMEQVGFEPGIVHGTVHTKAYYWRNWQQHKGSIQASDLTNQFNLYQLEWSPNHIQIYYNNIPYFYYHNEGSGWQAWPFDHPYHLIMNLAIGGVWGRAGGPIDDSIFPVRMEVDYVRFYRRNQPVDKQADSLPLE